MTRLRQELIRSYAEHYRRVNPALEKNKTDPTFARSWDLMCGHLLKQLPSGSEVLDLGCGAGILLSWIASYENISPVGVDGSAGQIQIAKQKVTRAQIECADGLEFVEGNPNRFSGIFCTDVLEHIPTDDLLLRWVEAAAGALKPGGFFFARSPNAAHLAGSYTRYIDLTHERSFTSLSFLQLLTAAGLQDVRVVPIRSGHWTGKVRLRVEHLLHRAVFRVCGHGLNEVHTSNICVLGYKNANGSVQSRSG